MVNFRATAECIAEYLEHCGFNDISDCSGFYIIKEFADGTDRAVDVYKSDNWGYPHYVIYCSYEDENYDFMYTDDLSVEQLESKLIEFYTAE